MNVIDWDKVLSMKHEHDVVSHGLCRLLEIKSRLNDIYKYVVEYNELIEEIDELVKRLNISS